MTQPVPTLHPSKLCFCVFCVFKVCAAFCLVEMLTPETIVA